MMNQFFFCFHIYIVINSINQKSNRSMNLLHKQILYTHIHEMYLHEAIYSLNGMITHTHSYFIHS